MRLPTLFLFLAAAPVFAGGPSSAAELAIADIGSVPAADRPYTRYLSAYNTPGPQALVLATHVVNSISRAVAVHRPIQVAPNLFRINLYEVRVDPEAWDRLAGRGSGRNPLPDPYFHITIDTVETQEWGYYKGDQWIKTGDRPTGKRTTTIAHAPWLPPGIAKLATETRCTAPILRLDWFAYNAMLEPRYHELLGFGEDEKSIQKLAGAEERAADDEGAQVRGAVIRSRVATNNRSLERTPTRRSYGRGYYWKSFDYGSSVDANDILADANSVLNPKADAHEIIFSLPNGYQAYAVTDGAGKRLDRAAVEFARDIENGFRSVEVEIRNCACCHAKGIVPIADSVRANARNELAVAVDLIKDAKLKDRFIAKFMAIDIDELVTQDCATFDRVVKASTGLAATAVGEVFRNALLEYEKPVTVETLAREAGCTVEQLRAAVRGSSNLHHSLVLLTRAVPAERQSIESKGFQQLMGGLRR